MVYDIGTPAEHRMRHRPVNECATEQLIGPALTTQIERGAGSHSALGFAKFVRPELPGGIKASGIRPRICYLFHVFKNTTSGKIPRPHKSQISDREFESRGRHSVEKVCPSMALVQLPVHIYGQSYISDCGVGPARAGSTSHHGQRVDFCGDVGFSQSSIYASQCRNQVSGSRYLVSAL